MQTVPETAKIFTTGRSQAVRLPKAFRFNTSEVTIERQGDSVILRPKLSREEWWNKMEKVLGAFEGMPETIERTRGDLREPVNFD
jgi:antitoxin VapB